MKATLILPVPLDPFTPIDLEEVLAYFGRLQRFMSGRFGGRYEILLAPYGERRPAFGTLLTRLTLMTEGRKAFRWVRTGHAGMGDAVREAVFLSRGAKILVANLECHYAPSFFAHAVEALRAGRVGVLANRRLPDSEFTVPVPYLSLVYRRHLLGMLLSRIWSLLFAFPLTDNLSGAYVLERDFALKAFNRLTCPNFLYEAEIALVAKVNQKVLMDLPAGFLLTREKPRLRVYREIASVLRWTLRFLVQIRRGDYVFLRANRNRLTADDWGLSPGVNEGILEAARSGHVRRVSLLAGGRFVRHRLKELQQVRGIEFGLHFNLTNPESSGPFDSLAHFLWAWYAGPGPARRSLMERIRHSLRYQLALMKRLDIRPRSLEGHHHVHVVPGLLEGIQDILKDAGIGRIRAPYHPSLWLGRRAPLAWFGKRAQRTASKLGFHFDRFYYPSPSDLSGFNRWVRCLNRTFDSEVLVHPACRDDIRWASPSDSYREQRVREYELLRLLTIERGGVE